MVESFPRYSRYKNQTRILHSSYGISGTKIKGIFAQIDNVCNTRIYSICPMTTMNIGNIHPINYHFEKSYRKVKVELSCQV